MSRFPRYQVLQLVPPGKILDRLIDGIKRGVKTATSALEVSFAMSGERLPALGDRYTLIDSDDSPVFDIEVTRVKVSRLADVGLDVALAEGDWFETIAQWRAAHERFFNESAEQVAAHLGLPTWHADDDTMVVVRFFRLI